MSDIKIGRVKNGLAIKLLGIMECILGVCMMSATFWRCWCDTAPAMLLEFAYKMIPFLMCHGWWMVTATKKKQSSKRPQYVTIKDETLYS